MTIYQHRAVITASAGSTNTTTLNIRGGLCRQILVTANSASTVFMANITDESGMRITNYGYQTGELNDIPSSLPMAGRYTLSITNASPDDTFKVLIGVEE